MLNPAIVWQAKEADEANPVQMAASRLHLVQDSADITLDPHQLPAKVQTPSLMATDVPMQRDMHSLAAGLAARLLISYCLRKALFNPAQNPRIGKFQDVVLHDHTGS